MRNEYAHGDPARRCGGNGNTGYAEMPHLHMSVHINNIAIDPVKFLALFGVNL